MPAYWLIQKDFLCLSVFVCLCRLWVKLLITVWKIGSAFSLQGTWGFLSLICNVMWFILILVKDFIGYSAVQALLM